MEHHGVSLVRRLARAAREHALHGAELRTPEAVRRFAADRRRDRHAVVARDAQKPRRRAAHRRKQVALCRIEVIAAERDAHAVRMAQHVRQDPVLLHREAVEGVDRHRRAAEEIRVRREQRVQPREVVERVEIRLLHERFIRAVDQRDLAELLAQAAVAGERGDLRQPVRRDAAELHLADRRQHDVRHAPGRRALFEQGELIGAGLDRERHQNAAAAVRQPLAGLPAVAQERRFGKPREAVHADAVRRFHAEGFKQRALRFKRILLRHNQDRLRCFFRRKLRAQQRRLSRSGTAEYKLQHRVPPPFPRADGQGRAACAVCGYYSTDRAMRQKAQADR